MNLMAKKLGLISQRFHYDTISSEASEEIEIAKIKERPGFEF